MVSINNADNSEIANKTEAENGLSCGFRIFAPARSPSPDSERPAEDKAGNQLATRASASYSRTCCFRALAVMLLLLSTGGSVRGAILYTYDQDSLVYMAEHVLECTIGASSREHNFQVWDVTVAKVYKGDKTTGDHLQVTALDYFTKVVGDDAWGGGSTVKLSEGDHVFLFLGRARDTFLYTIPEDAEVFWPVPSGVKLVVNQTVYGFSQWMSNPGPYMQEKGKRFSARNAELIAFRRGLPELVTRMQELKDRIKVAAHDGDVRFMHEFLKKRSADLKISDDASRDHLREVVCAMLANTHNIQAIDETLEFDTSSMLERGFGTPEGRDFLLRKIDDQGCSQERKLRYVWALKEAGNVYRSTISEISSNSSKTDGDAGPDNDWYLTRIAELASKNVQDDLLCQSLIDCVAELGGGVFRRQKDPANSDTRNSLAVLRELFESGVSESLQYHIELATLEMDPNSYGLLHSTCGPVISILTPAEPMKNELRVPLRAC